jgi:Family of unknown function (DUF5522)
LPKFGDNPFVISNLQTPTGCKRLIYKGLSPNMGEGGYLVGGTRDWKGVKKENKAGTMTKPVKLDEEPTASPKMEPGAEELRPEDFYYEGPYLVFTAAYHLKRGYCCNSDCRHCPYK